MGVWWHALAFVTHERAKMSHKPGRNVTQAGPKCHTRAKISHSHVIIHWIRADLSETPDNALTTPMHGDYRLLIDRFFVGFNVICYTFLRNNPIYIEGRNCMFSTIPGLFNKCSAFGPRTPYRVGGLADNVMRARVSHSLVNHWICNSKASLLLC